MRRNTVAVYVRVCTTTDTVTHKPRGLLISTAQYRRLHGEREYWSRHIASYIRAKISLSTKIYINKIFQGHEK